MYAPQRPTQERRLQQLSDWTNGGVRGRLKTPSSVGAELRPRTSLGCANGRQERQTGRTERTEL